MSTSLEKNWEIKDRYYYLKGKKQPVVRMIRSTGIMWFDEEKGYEREIMFTKNQKTLFVDEFKGNPILEHIAFRDGVLFVPKNKVTLQKLLSLYHPGKNKIYEEEDLVKEAVDELTFIELELEALNTAKNMNIEQAEAIMRVEVGAKVSKMTTQEIRRDLLIMARRSPESFMALAADENISVRNIGIKATEQGIIKLADDQRTFKWGSNGRKLMTVPFDENPYSALAAWFKTDEGIEVFQTIEKRLKE